MATIQIKLKPFVVPNYAVVDEGPRPRQEGLHMGSTIPLADLSDDTFHDMVRDWLKAVYDKAGKRYSWRFD